MREALLSSSVGYRHAGETPLGPCENATTAERIFALMGHSKSIQQIQRQIQLVARTMFTVMIEGETGTGKELVARLLHEHSARADKAFVAIDCGAIPESLVESELFGYVKGAFTGAESRKAGYCELAKGGTLCPWTCAWWSPPMPS